MARSLRPRRNRRFRCPPNMEKATCQEILRDVWQLKWEPENAPQNVPPNPYIDYWINCVLEADQPSLCLDDRKIAVGLVRRIKAGLRETLPVLKESMKGVYPDKDGSPRTISSEDTGTALAFAIRLWLHVRPNIDWKCPPSTTLDHIVRDCVPEPADSNTIIEGRLSNDFCAKHLWRKGGLDVRWTDDISQHLLLQERHIYVFRHSNSLRALHDCPSLDPFPSDFITETLDTLYLLYRPMDIKMYRRNRRQMDKYMTMDLEIAIAKQASFDLNNYRHWHKRLQVIQTVYDKSTPRSLQQWWFDRRDRITWATFWLAFVVFILTILFGLIQSVTGILQVIAAYHPRSS